MKKYIIFLIGSISGVFIFNYFKQKKPTPPPCKFIVYYKNGQSDSATAFYKNCNTIQLYNHGSDKYAYLKDIITIQEVTEPN